MNTGSTENDANGVERVGILGLCFQRCSGCFPGGALLVHRQVLLSSKSQIVRPGTTGSQGPLGQLQRLARIVVGGRNVRQQEQGPVGIGILIQHLQTQAMHALIVFAEQRFLSRSQNGRKGICHVQALDNG